MITRRIIVASPLALAFPQNGDAASHQKQKAISNCAAIIEDGMERRFSTALTIAVSQLRNSEVIDLDGTRMVPLSVRLRTGDAHIDHGFDECVAVLASDMAHEIGDARLAAIVGRRVICPESFETVMAFRGRVRYVPQMGWRKR